MIRKIKLYLFLAVFLLFAFTNNYSIANTSELPTNQFIGSVNVEGWSEFTPTGNLYNARRDHTTIMLPNGLVLVAGGSNGSSCLATSELYDPDTGTWTMTGSMNVNRCAHTLTLLQDGTVLAAGGFSKVGDVITQLNSAEVYNPDSGTWANTGTFSNARHKHTATLMKDGKVLLAGGYDSLLFFENSEIYNPFTGSWSTTDNLNYIRAGHKAGLLDNGKILIAGDWNFETKPSIAELFDPLVSIWFNSGSMSSDRIWHTMNLLNDGSALVAGGISGNSELSSSEIYNPTTGVWNLTGNMNYPRKEHTGTTLGYGKVLVTGGSIENTTLKITDLYDPTTDTWSLTAPMNTSRRYHAETLLNDTQVLVSGGYDGVTSAINSTEIGTIVPENTITGTLILPSGWINSTSFSVEFIGNSSGADVNAGSLSNDNTSWGDWIDVSPDQIVSTTWDVGIEGEDLPVYLRIRDIYDQAGMVTTGSVDVDITAPTGNVSINTYSIPLEVVTLLLTASDNLSGVDSMQVSSSENFDGIDWEPFKESYEWDMNGAFRVYVRFRDNAGNISNIYHNETPYILFLPITIR